MKKFISGFLCCAVLCSVCIFASNLFANQPIDLVVDHKVIQCDVPPQIINGRVMVPARYVAEALGAEVEWSEKYNTVFIYSNKKPSAQATQTVQEQQLEKLKYFYQKVQAAAGSTADVLNNTVNALEKDKHYPVNQELTNQIEYLKSLDGELTSWGTLDEYKEIKRLFIQAVNQMGNCLIYTRSAISNNYSQTDLNIANSYMLKYQDTARQTKAEIESLKLKGLLKTTN